MDRYGVVATEKGNNDDATIHFFKRGTLVKFLSMDEVETLLPTKGVAFLNAACETTVSQHIEPGDVIELPEDQLKMLMACIPLRPTQLACACVDAFPETTSNAEALAKVRAIPKRDLTRKLGEKLLALDPDELFRRLHYLPTNGVSA